MAELASIQHSNQAHLHLVIEDLRLACCSRRNKVLVKDLEDVFANLRELGFDPLAVAFNHRYLGLIAFRLFLLLDGRYNPPRRTSRANDVLVRNGEEIALLDGEFLIGRSYTLHVLDHLCVGRVSR